MLSKMIRTFIKRSIVAEVPDEMAACLDCGAVECSHGKYENFPYRLARVAALSAAPSCQASIVP